MDILAAIIGILLALGVVIGFTITYFNVDDDSFDKSFYKTIKKNNKKSW
jgi:hypothetical protein